MGATAQLPDINDRTPLDKALWHLEEIGVRTPCQSTDADLWFADKQAQRALACQLCEQCPIQQACSDYATTSRQRWGVWAGTDHTTETNRR